MSFFTFRSMMLDLTCCFRFMATPAKNCLSVVPRQLLERQLPKWQMANGPARIRILWLWMVLTCPISHLVHLKRTKNKYDWHQMAQLKSHEDNNKSLFMFQRSCVPFIRSSGQKELFLVMRGEFCTVVSILASGLSCPGFELEEFSNVAVVIDSTQILQWTVKCLIKLIKVI